MDSMLDEGTCFTLLFPVKDKAYKKPIVRKVVEKATVTNHGDAVIYRSKTKHLFGRSPAVNYGCVGILY